MPDEPQSRFAQIGGLRLHYLTWGATRATPLLLLHDLGDTADAWLPLAGALGADFRVVAPDLRGHGDSDWIDTYAPQEIGDDAAELLGVLGLLPAAVAGIGLGGLAGALLAARQGYAVERLAMIESGVLVNMPVEQSLQTSLLAHRTTAADVAGWWADWQRTRVEAGLRQDRPAPLPISPRLVRRTAGRDYVPAWDQQGYAAYRAWSPGRRVVSYAEEFHEIDVPVLVVRGEDSPLLTSDAARSTAAVIADCRCATVPAARHDLLHDNPTGLLAVLLPFLRGNE